MLEACRLQRMRRGRDAAAAGAATLPWLAASQLLDSFSLAAARPRKSVQGRCWAELVLGRWGAVIKDLTRLWWALGSWQSWADAAQ